MPQALTTIPQEPVVYIPNGEIYANSCDVAAALVKEHRTLYQAAERLLRRDPGCDAHLRATLIDVPMPNGGTRSSKGLEMTQAGFVMVAMSLTGPGPAAFKRRYIAKFDEMRAELQRRPVAASIDLNDPASFRQVLLGYTERVLTLETTVADQKDQIAKAAPKAAAWEAYKDAEGLYSLSDVGRILGTGAQKTIEWMVSKGLLFRMGCGSPLRPMERYARRGWFVPKSRVIDGVERIQTFATPRGLAEIVELIGKPLDLFGRIDRSRQGQLLPN